MDKNVTLTFLPILVALILTSCGKPDSDAVSGYSRDSMEKLYVRYSNTWAYSSLQIKMPSGGTIPFVESSHGASTGQPVGSREFFIKMYN